MADPLSVASGVAGLLTLAGSVISQCYAYGCAVSGAPKEMKGLVDEVTNLSGLLVGLQGLIHAERLLVSQRAIMTRTVDDCDGTLREILDTLHQVKPASATGKLGKTVKRLLWPLHRDQALALIHRLERQRDTLAFALSTDIGAGVYETQIILADMQFGLQEDRLERRAREGLENKRKVLQWLSDIDYEAKHTLASDLQRPGVGSWLLQSPQLQSWIQGDISFLWIYGIPGSGKTIWTSIILNQCIFPHLSEKLFAAFYYFDFRDAASEKPENALGAIISQLCNWLDPFPSEVEEALQRYTSLEGRVAPPSFEELTRLLIHVLDLCPPVLLVIDALDECVERDTMSRLLHALASKMGSKVRVLITSRREIGLERLFRESPQMSVQSHAADQEICQMIVTEISVHPRFQNLGETLKAAIITSLSDGAGGMFRWVRCQLDELARLRTPKAIREALKSLPRDLNETYARILERISEPDRLLARRALLWLAYATRPLSLAELAEAAIFDGDTDELDTETRLKDPEEILEVCGSLTSRTDPTSRVILAHNSVRDYLIADYVANRPPYFHFKPSESSIEIAQSCLRYLLLRNFASGPTTTTTTTQERIQSYPLLLYAAHNWSEHGRDYLASNEILFQLTSLLFAPSPLPQFYSWVQSLLLNPLAVQRRFDRWPRNATPLYYAASFGIASAVKNLIDAKVNLDVRGGTYGGSPLHAACWRRHPDIAKMLLDAGADPGVTDNQNMNPADLAQMSGNRGIRSMLVGHMANGDPHRRLWEPRTVR